MTGSCPTRSKPARHIYRKVPIMTTWQTDVIDTEKLALDALLQLFRPYGRPVTMAADGLEIWFEPAGVNTDAPPVEVPAPTDSEAWHTVARLTAGLAQMGQFVTRGIVWHEDVKWAVTCRRARQEYAQPTQSIWPWAD